MPMNVDVVVTTYKRYELLREALQSIADQSYPHWRCWIAEDGESKETYHVVKPFLRDDRFVYLPGEHAGFPAVPKNRAIRQGNCRYIAVLDDDDLWLPRKLEYQIAFMESHPDCVLLGCNAYRWDGSGRWDESPLYFTRDKLGKISYNKLLDQNCFIHSSVMFRRTAIEKSGLYSEKLSPPIGDDYELWLRIGALGNMWSLPEPLVVFRQTPLTYYSKQDRRENYKTMAGIFGSALKGVEGVPNPLLYPKNARLAAACRRERDFYLAGPRLLGRLRHELRLKIKQKFSF